MRFWRCLATLGDGWRWLEMAGDGWRWLEMALDVSKLFEMLGDGWRELAKTGDGRTPSTETPRLSLPSIFSLPTPALYT